MNALQRSKDGPHWTGQKRWGLGLMTTGVLTSSALIALVIKNLFDHEHSLMTTRWGVLLILLALAVTLTGFCLLANWTDPFPVDDPERPPVRTFEEDRLHECAGRPE